MRSISISRDEAEMIVDLLEGDWKGYDQNRMDGRLIEVASQIRVTLGMCTREESAGLRAEMGLTKRNL